MNIWNSFSDNKSQIEKNYNEHNWNEKTGIGAEQLKKECFAIADDLKNEPESIIKARVFEYIMENAQIEVNPCNFFATQINHGDIIIELRKEWKKSIDNNEMKDIINQNAFAQERCLYTGDVDFSHTVPDWNAILDLGVTGLLERAEERLKNKELSVDQIKFYQSCVIVYKSFLCFIKRLSEEAYSLSKGNDIMKMVAENLKALTKKAPQTLIEAMQLSMLFYYVQTFIEGTNLRSLGGIDRLYYKFYYNDLKENKFTKENIREIVDYYYYNYYAMAAISNTPFYLCGKNTEGLEAVNELSHLLIEEYGKVNVSDPKIHIRYTKDMEEAFLKKVLQLISEGKNSIAFLNDEVIIDSLVKIGIDEIDSINYAPVGCYEPSALGKEVSCTCAGRINIAKAIECALNNGCDQTGKKLVSIPNQNILSFDDFMSSVKNVLRSSIERVMNLINSYEKYYMRINPSPFFSGTMAECIESGMDVYSGGAKYNNTSINAFGIADAVDSIVVIKKVVFDDKKRSLEEFKNILRDNWNDNDDFRCECKNLYSKYGNNDDEADDIMKELVDFLANEINNKPNQRGGVYRFGMFSIDWYTSFGGNTGALPDGRLNGEPISKNLNSVIGQDRNGVTSLINSITKIDFSKTPNGAVLDLLLHSSVAKGEEGIVAMLGLLKAFMLKGGFGIQINVLDPNVLKKAQKNPDQYKNLQIRLCGWNVYFVNLTKQEQNEFISMSINSEMSI